MSSKASWISLSSKFFGTCQARDSDYRGKSVMFAYLLWEGLLLVVERMAVSLLFEHQEHMRWSEWTKDTITLERISQPSKTQRGPGQVVIIELIYQLQSSHIWSDSCARKIFSWNGWHSPDTSNKSVSIEQSTEILHHPRTLEAMQQHQYFTIFTQFPSQNEKTCSKMSNMSLITFFHTCPHWGRDQPRTFLCHPSHLAQNSATTLGP